MKNDLKKISITSIKPGKNEGRSKGVSYNSLYESIKRNGVLTPLTVYEEEGNYVVLNGHRRLDVAKKLNIQYLNCNVVDKPVNELKATQVRLEGNIHRNSNDEISKEILIAKESFDKMPSSEKEKWAEYLKQCFISQYKNDERFKNDKARFMSNNFRLESEYIKAMTGIDMSPKTISAKIKEAQNGSEMPVRAKSAKPKNKKEYVTVDDVSNSLTAILGILNGFRESPEFNPALSKELKEILEALISFKASVEF